MSFLDVDYEAQRGKRNDAALSEGSTQQEVGNLQVKAIDGALRATDHSENSELKKPGRLRTSFHVLNSLVQRKL